MGLRPDRRSRPSHTTSSAPSSPPYLLPRHRAPSSGHKKNPPTRERTRSWHLVFTSSSTGLPTARSSSMLAGRRWRRRRREWEHTSRRVGRGCWRRCLVYDWMKLKALVGVFQRDFDDGRVRRTLRAACRLASGLEAKQTKCSHLSDSSALVQKTA